MDLFTHRFATFQRMKTILGFFAILFLANFEKPDPSLPEQCQTFHELNTRIRDNQLDKKTASQQLKNWWKSMSETLPSKTRKTSIWLFPVNGYNVSAVGGKNGNGYLPKGYHYLDGNRHGGHPAHDIFIRDRNQDSKDDQTGLPVPVVSMFEGVVVSVESGWVKNSELRGGKYVMVFHPEVGLLSYYAHLDSVFVHIGQSVNPGTELGTIGRSGKNAAKKRSPTHLHLMLLSFDQTKGLVPVNPYPKW
jgi:peptidoglycan LD-endopeptidase LytH